MRLCERGRACAGTVAGSMKAQLRRQPEAVGRSHIDVLSVTLGHGRDAAGSAGVAGRPAEEHARVERQHLEIKREKDCSAILQDGTHQANLHLLRKKSAGG